MLTLLLTSYDPRRLPVIPPKTPRRSPSTGLFERTIVAATEIDERVDFPTAKLAIEEYGARNDMFHSKSIAYKQSFVVGDFTNERNPIVQGLANSRRNEHESSLPVMSSGKRLFVSDPHPIRW